VQIVSLYVPISISIIVNVKMKYKMRSSFFPALYRWFQPHSTHFTQPQLQMAE